jgi:hypothetical protein
MSWQYNPEKSLFLPSIGLKEITQGDAGQTIAIPVTPPSGGFDQPPIPLPPPVPPIPSIPSIGGGGGVNFVPPLYGHDNTNNLDLFYITPGIYFDGTTTSECNGVWRVPNSYTSETVTISVAISMSGTGTVNAKLNVYRERCGIAASVVDVDSYSDVSVTGGLPRYLNCIYAKEVSSSLSLQAGDFVRINFDRAGTAGSGTDSGDDGYVLGFIISII